MSKIRSLSLSIGLLALASAVYAQDASYPDHNNIDNEDQIDREDELALASTAPHEKSAQELSKQLVPSPPFNWKIRKNLKVFMV
jgi:hypothetical protein